MRRSKVKVGCGNITLMPSDFAIVNAANPRCLGGGGVDGSIHRAAGPELREHCAQWAELCYQPGVRLRVGEARVSPSFNLGMKGIIHTVGPMFPEGRMPSYPGEVISSSPEEDLENCLRSCLKMAEYVTDKVAFPAISCGVYGCPIHVFAECAFRVFYEQDWALDIVMFVLFTEDELDQFQSKWNGLWLKR